MFGLEIAEEMNLPEDSFEVDFVLNEHEFFYSDLYIELGISGETDFAVGSLPELFEKNISWPDVELFHIILNYIVFRKEN